MSNEQLPIIVGVGQVTNRAASLAEVMEPLALMEEAARAAAADTAAPALLSGLDSVTVINIISHPYEDPPRQLASRLGAQPKECLYTLMGGNSPQWRINETADRIARGEVRVALIAGAEALHSLNLARKAGATLEWGSRGKPGQTVGDALPGSNAAEQAHGAYLPIRVYPLFENALRAQRGWSIERHRTYLAALCAGMAAIAANNPGAWFRDGKDAATIGTETAENRMISFPYLKYMNAIMNIDQGAALLLTNVETARRAGIPEEKWVYVRGCGDGHDHWFVSDRCDYHTSPALRLAGQRALAQAGCEIDAIDFFDLYSCFPSAVQMAACMLGIAVDDPRPLTVTGGLPYHGGPGSNYSTHAIATLVERLRARPGSLGLATGVGWYLTKHSVGVYSTAPGAATWRRQDVESDQRILLAAPHPALCERAEGSARVETYTVVHERDGSPALGIAVLRLDDGRRCWANLHDAATLAAMEQHELIGQTVRVRHAAAEKVNLVEV